MDKQTTILRIVFGLLVVAQVHCVPPTGYQASDSQGATGFTTPQGRPYTIGGDARVYESQKKQTQLPPEAVSANKNLAETITQVRVVRFDAKNKADRLGTHSVRLDIELQNAQKISFQGALTSAGAHRFVSAPLVGSLKSLQAEIEFEDAPSQSDSTGKIKLSRLDEKKQPEATIEILLRSYTAATHTELSIEQNLNPVNRRFVQLLEQRAFAWVANIVIPSGRSFYEVHVFAQNKKTNQKWDNVDAFAAGQRLFLFAGEALRTGDFSDAPATRLQAGLMTPISVELIGDAESTDQRTFAVLIRGYEGQNIDLAIEIAKPETDSPTTPSAPTNGSIVPAVPSGLFNPPSVPSTQPQSASATTPASAPAKILKGQMANAFLPVDYNRLSSASVQKMVNDFELNFNVPGVQSWINIYSDNESKRTALVKALSYAHPFRPLVQEIFQRYGVAPSAALVTFIESRFFGGGEYKLETNPVSTATGPFQLLYGTAKGMGLKVFENKEGALPSDGDHRLYFVPSACGAAEHLQKSIATIAQKDSTMALAAYYLGNMGVAAKIHVAITGTKPQKKDQLQLIKKYNFMYQEVSKQKMLPAHVLNYVNKALALYFVTGNPTTYQVTWDENTQKTLPANKVLPPIGEIKNPLCQQSVVSLIREGRFR